MKNLPVSEKIKLMLEPKKGGIQARLFVTREDGITLYDSVQDTTSSSVAALVSGVWQASEALMKLVKSDSQDLHYRLGYDTSSEGIFIFPVSLQGKKYFLGAIYEDCLNPGLLKRQITLIKQELELFLVNSEPEKKATVSTTRSGYLFSEITDEEIDRLFSVGGF